MHVSGQYWPFALLLFQFVHKRVGGS